MPKYWDHGETVKTSFFGTYMGCNTFQSIMSNLQVADLTQVGDLDFLRAYLAELSITLTN